MSREKKGAAKQAAVTKKKPSAAKKTVSVPQARKIKTKPLKWYDLHRLRRRPRSKVKHKNPVKLPKAWQLTVTTWNTLWRHRRLFVAISIVYGLLDSMLGKNFSFGVDISGIRAAFDKSAGGHPNPIISGLGTFGNLLNPSSSSGTGGSGSYQLMLLIVASLAIIWALRQVLAGLEIRMRDAYYRGMYPLIPFILVTLVIGLQLIPLSIGATIYTKIAAGGIAITVMEKVLTAVGFGLLAAWTLYMLSASIFALYIVTLPDMTPTKALRSAREIVRYRRWVVLRKILWLPIILLIITAIIMVPTIVVFAPLAQWIYLLLGMLLPLAAHSYMYTLYRELLREK